MIIDLRSDTVTKPSKGMLDAMMSAKTGDDVFREDPTINLLEQRIASLFGKETALFFPSGTMANQVAIKLHTNPGDQVICDKFAHIYNYESGGVSFNSGVSCHLIDGDRGMFTAEQVKQAINPDDYYYSESKLVEVENTTNKGGGACWNFDELVKIKQVCDNHKLGLHLDGARLWNAMVAKTQSANQFGAIFDTISVCLSKGLGCPVGSLLVGNADIMQKAIRLRKVFGGNMRQAGFLAAAGLYALDHNIDRLEEDHLKAKEIESLLVDLAIIKKVESVETNIIVFELNNTVDETTFLNLLEKHQIKISSMGNNKLRIVTHMNYTDEMHNSFKKILTSI